MKKSLLFPVLACSLLLTSCGEGVQLEAKTFEDQCKLAGIEFTYVDRNADVKKPVEKPAKSEWDVVTGTSGNDLYLENGGSYFTYEQMYERFGARYYDYFWYTAEEVTANRGDVSKLTAVKTLAEAAKLDNAKYATKMFPNDGKEYYLFERSNALASKTLIAYSKEAGVLPSAAIYGFGGMTKDETGYYIGGTGMTKNNVKYLVETGKALMLVYEYNPESFDKAGAGTRNYGCRLELDLVPEKSSYLGVEDAVKVGEAWPEKAQGLNFTLKVSKLLPLA